MTDSDKKNEPVIGLAFNSNCKTCGYSNLTDTSFETPASCIVTP